ncbi:MAG TPA: hypothetical protein VHL51_15050 [Gaiellales bacterium]|jgi:hypothetical protein|nr:hypothetical protein [Gaiellales bacterium]
MQERARTAGRVDDARDRARVGKAAMVALGIAVFGAGLLLTRSTASGHVKQGVRPLVAPRRFVRTVERNALAPGQIAPPQQAPPQASTSQS